MVWLGLFWVIVIILVALWRVGYLKRNHGSSEHKPAIVEIRPTQRTTLNTSSSQQSPSDLSTGYMPIGDKASLKQEFINRRLRFVSLLEVAEKQNIPEETKQIIKKEFEAKIAGIDSQLKQI